MIGLACGTPWVQLRIAFLCFFIVLSPAPPPSTNSGKRRWHVQLCQTLFSLQIGPFPFTNDAVAFFSLLGPAHFHSFIFLPLCSVDIRAELPTSNRLGSSAYTAHGSTRLQEFELFLKRCLLKTLCHLFLGRDWYEDDYIVVLFPPISVFIVSLRLAFNTWSCFLSLDLPFLII